MKKYKAGQHPNSIKNLVGGGAATRFVKGVCPNPGGRPNATFDVRRAARKASKDVVKF
jgi:hypothetical protein